MINTVIFDSGVGELVINLRGPFNDGLAITSMDGLTPPKASISTVGITNENGSKYSSSTIESRNIVVDFTFVYNTKMTVEQTRLKLYEYLKPGKPIKIFIITDNRHVYTNGYVESTDVDMFSNDTSATCSIVCPDPYFYDLNDNYVTESNILKEFEYPWSNESLSVDTLVMGQPLDDYYFNVINKGDGEIGFTAEIEIITPGSKLLIRNEGLERDFLIDSSKFPSYYERTFKTGDKILYSSVFGDKKVLLTRGNDSPINVIKAIATSSWLMSQPGLNTLSVSMDGVKNSTKTIISHKVRYLGV